jgi:hypothetical protein
VIRKAPCPNRVHLLLSALVFSYLITLTACGPQGPLGIIPGGPLAGEVMPDRVSDWRFTDDDITVAIETRGDWIDHSVTVMAAAEGSHLYVPSRQGYRKDWVQNIGRDPVVRIGVDDRIYIGRAVRVLEMPEAERADRALLRKYLGLEFDAVRPMLDPPNEGDDRIEVWLFRIESISESES